MTAEGLLERRRAQRRRLLGEARRFAERITPAVGLRAAVVFGSVARGDFNERSDIDVLVVADNLPADPLARLTGLHAELPPLVSVVAWTPEEWRRQLARNNPIALEARAGGVWLRGSATALGA